MRIFTDLVFLTFFLAIGIQAGTLYSTDFESFTVGENQWAGTDGWRSNDTSSGAQGILQNHVSNLPLGKTAYLGYDPPASAFTTVFKPVNYDPATGLIPVVEFDSFLGIQDSTNTRRDRFHVSFYNMTGGFLAAICFDNTLGKVVRYDGIVQADTGIQFVRGNQTLGFVALQILTARIDLLNNRWSASLDGIPLFSNMPFTATTEARTLGSVAAEWEIAVTSPFLAPGNNWLFVADLALRTVPSGIEPFRISSVVRDPAGQTTLTWPGEPGFDYRVFYSDDLMTWRGDLPGASFPGVSNTAELSFVDADAAPKARFFRVSRTPSP
jgi:hypothetical protein